jgi:hypothetical protein
MLSYELIIVWTLAVETLASYPHVPVSALPDARMLGQGFFARRSGQDPRPSASAANQACQIRTAFL